jgi:hypothetical protein
LQLASSASCKNVRVLVLVFGFANLLKKTIWNCWWKKNSSKKVKIKVTKKIGGKNSNLWHKSFLVSKSI